MRELPLGLFCSLYTQPTFRRPIPRQTPENAPLRPAVGPLPGAVSHSSPSHSPSRLCSTVRQRDCHILSSSGSLAHLPTHSPSRSRARQNLFFTYGFPTDFLCSSALYINPLFRQLIPAAPFQSSFSSHDLRGSHSAVHFLF